LAKSNQLPQKILLRDVAAYPAPKELTVRVMKNPGFFIIRWIPCAFFLVTWFCRATNWVKVAFTYSRIWSSFL